MATVLGKTPAIKMPDTRLLIDGKFVEAASGKTFETFSPATEETIAMVSRASKPDADRAVAAARAALEGSWSRFSAAERARILMNFAALMRANAEQLAELEALDGGKPVSSIKRAELPAAIDCLEYYAGWCDKIKGDVVPISPSALNYILREPVGVVVAIVPWNFPLMNTMWKIAPALACGCTMVLKPAELTPLTALRLGELALEAGVPPGVLNVLPGSGSDVGTALVDRGDIDKIAFTGSPSVGKIIMQTAGKYIVRVGLELGGKSPNVVFADSDLEAAIKAASSGVFYNAGQVCSAGTRIVVEESIYDEFVAGLKARAKSLRMGDPLDPNTTLGPIISQQQLERVAEYIDVGQKEGATLESGGKRPEGRGHYLEPTIFTDVRNDMRIAQEEIFGPVASVIKFKTEDEAVAIANGTPYSLAAAVWSNDVTKVLSVAHRLKAGTVWVNTYGHTDTRLPWGGAGGESGISRDLGEAALENYTERKAVWVNLRRGGK
jgi:aldehyde dehydrogenase (NAD+)